MNDWQLFAVIGVPSIITLIGMAQNNKRFELLEKRMGGMDKRMDGIDRAIVTIQGQIASIRRDLQQFFRDLGRHEEAIDTLKSKS
jgi:hypothetical protein